jgi:nucleoside phosphorylase
MPTVAHLRWKLVTELESKAVAALPSLFNFSTGKTFIRTLGGRSTLAFSPQSLSPNNRFYDLLRKKAEGLGFTGRKFPLSYNEGLSEQTRSINVQFRLYGKALLVVDIELKPFEVGTSVDLIALSDLWASGLLNSFAMTLVGLVVSGERTYRPAGQRPKVYPSVLVVAPRSELPDDREAVELLTRHREPSAMVVEAVLAKNRRLQIDASTLLIDRQGVVALLPIEYATNVTIRRRFVSASNMLELMGCLRRMMEQAKLYELGAQELAEIAKVFKAPEERFVHSTSSLHMWQLTADEFRLGADQFTEEEREVQQRDPINIPARKVLVVTALDTEATAVLKRLEPGNVGTIESIYVSTGRLQSAAGTADVYVFPTGVGNTPSALKTAMLIEAVRPQLTVFCGIAGGRKDAKIGSVVVASMVYLYESGKEEKSRFSPRPRIVDLSPTADSLATAFLARLRLEKLDYEVFFKPIACGEKLLGSGTGPSAGLVSTTYGDALAIEMEGFGFLSAIRNGKAPGLLVRGVSDLLDNKEDEEDHELAANNAADLVLRLIAFFLTIPPNAGP